MTGINDYGQVVGWTAGGSGVRPFVWTPTSHNGTTGSVSTPAGLFDGASTDAWAINASGQIVGRSDNRAVLWNPTTPNSGTFGAPVEVTQPGGTSLNIALGINTTGQITGRSLAMKTEAFLYTPTSPNGSTGSVIQLGSLPPAQVSFGTGINSYGQVTGTSFGAFVWTPNAPNGTSGQLTRLASALNSGQVFSLAINRPGSVTGPYTSGSSTRSFLWSPATPNGSTGSYVDLGTLSGSTRVAAAGLNDQNEVVGDYGLGSGGFLWTPTDGIRDLNTLLDPATSAGWSVRHAYVINNLGQIGADAVLNQGGQQSGHFVLLSSVVPEPSYLPLMVLLGAIVLVRRRRGWVAARHGAMTASASRQRGRPWTTGVCSHGSGP